MPSTSAHAAASRCSVAVLGPSWSWSGASISPASAVKAFLSTLPVAADLDLGIPAAEKRQLALGQPAAIVAAPVQPVALAVRIGHEGSPRALGIVDVSPTYTDPGEDELTWCAERHR